MLSYVTYKNCTSTVHRCGHINRLIQTPVNLYVHLHCAVIFLVLIYSQGLKRRTIYEYHRVEIGQAKIRNLSAVILKPVPSESSIILACLK